jgi:hypothetical protein
MDGVSSKSLVRNVQSSTRRADCTLRGSASALRP